MHLISLNISLSDIYNMAIDYLEFGILLKKFFGSESSFKNKHLLKFSYLASSYNNSSTAPPVMQPSRHPKSFVNRKHIIKGWKDKGSSEQLSTRGSTLRSQNQPMWKQQFPDAHHSPSLLGYNFCVLVL